MESLEALKELGVPIFGYTLDSSDTEKGGAIKQMSQWWKKNYTVFEDNEGVPLSQHDLQKVKANIRILGAMIDQMIK